MLPYEKGMNFPMRTIELLKLNPIPRGANYMRWDSFHMGPGYMYAHQLLYIVEGFSPIRRRCICHSLNQRDFHLQAQRSFLCPGDRSGVAAEPLPVTADFQHQKKTDPRKGEIPRINAAAIADPVDENSGGKIKKNLSK